MKTVHILNPAAGKGTALDFSDRDNSYITQSRGDVCRYVKQTLASTPDITFAVYGGDGTVNEVVEGIVSTSPDASSLSVVPTGTGNDLVRTLEETDDPFPVIDVLTLNDDYAVNAVNTGFDLSVVLKAAKFKKYPLVSGTLAYILGIVSALFDKYGKHLHIQYTDKDGATFEYDGDCLLCVAANGKYYGGGFKCAPIADITDGLIDLLVIKKVSRLKFISLVGAYRKGNHIDASTGKLLPRFEKIVTFCKCKRVIIDGLDEICADGEVMTASRADIGILPRKLKIVRREI